MPFCKSARLNISSIILPPTIIKASAVNTIKLSNTTSIKATWKSCKRPLCLKVGKSLLNDAIEQRTPFIAKYAVIIKLNDKRTLSQNNLDVVKIDKSIIKRKKEEKLSIFSDSHYLDLEKKAYIEINE